MEESYDRAYLEALAHKYRQGTITPEEQAYFDKWYGAHSDTGIDLSDNPVSPEQIRKQMLGNIQDHIRAGKPARIIRYWKYTAVAAAIALCSVTAYLYFSSSTNNRPTIIAESLIQPGTNGATLTLANGKKIVLEQTGAGIIQAEANVKLEKANDSLLIYTAGQNAPAEMSYNILETPKGRQYAVVLPDGTKVFLNAASTLKYPTQFTGKLRTVELTGEGYFQVAHNKAMPFIVRTATQAVKVLGTEFNINSYADEGRTVTTLETGSIQVQAGTAYKLIRPGQQSILRADGSLNVRQADMESAFSWKHNKMVFEDAGIEEIMRQVSRWYDLDIRYEGKIPDDTFTGTINRESSLATVLKMFDLTAIRFSVEQTGGRKTLIIKT